MPVGGEGRARRRVGAPPGVVSNAEMFRKQVPEVERRSALWIYCHQNLLFCAMHSRWTHSTVPYLPNLAENKILLLRKCFEHEICTLLQWASFTVYFYSLLCRLWQYNLWKLPMSPREIDRRSDHLYPVLVFRWQPGIQHEAHQRSAYGVSENSCVLDRVWNDHCMVLGYYYK